LAHTPQPRQDFDPRHQTRHPDHRDLHCTKADAIAWARVADAGDAAAESTSDSLWLPQKRPVGRPEFTYGQMVVRTVRAVEAAGGLAQPATAVAAAAAAVAAAVATKAVDVAAVALRV
jgi:hypothetical protein